MRDLVAGTIVRAYGESEPCEILHIIENEESYVKYRVRNTGSNKETELYDNVIFEVISPLSVEKQSKAVTDVTSVQRTNKKNLVREEYEVEVKAPQQPSYVVVSDSVQSYLANYMQTKREKCRVIYECIEHLQNHTEEKSDEIIAEVIIKLTKKLEKSLKSKAKN